MDLLGSQAIAKQWFLNIAKTLVNPISGHLADVVTYVGINNCTPHMVFDEDMVRNDYKDIHRCLVLLENSI